MKAQTPSLGKITLHALGSAIGGVFVALGVGYAGVAYGNASDATGWAAIGYAAVGAILGFPIGVWLTTLGLGKLLKVPGSAAWSFVGMLLGIGGLFALMRVASGSSWFIALGAVIVVATTLIGYHAPWRK